MGDILKHYFNSNESKKKIDEIMKEFPIISVISALAMIYDKNIAEIEPFFQNKIIENKKYSNVKTIGIYNPIYEYGGIERVLSYYFQMFGKMGYNIIFFTDSISKNEYFISDNITRIIIKHTHFFDFKLRLTELSNYIKEYNQIKRLSIAKPFSSCNYRFSSNISSIGLPTKLDGFCKSKFFKMVAPISPKDSLSSR